MTSAEIICYLSGYIFLLLTSGIVLKYVFKVISDVSPVIDTTQERAGNIIGKCENFLILSLMFLNAYTALSLIFTAKAFVRKEDIEKNPVYFLVGTIVNFTYSVMVGMGIKLVILFLKQRMCCCL